MHEIMVPNEVTILELMDNGSLSPSNYKKLSISNQEKKQIKDYLVKDIPYIKGKEPGSSAYVKKSEQKFIRNSCINNIQFSTDKSKYIYLNPNYYDENNLKTGDILFCTDANIGDCCFYISDGEKVIFSSGMIKLNFKVDREKYYVMAFMRDKYFIGQLDAKTPKGATIRHSGDRFLECEIPECPKDWVYGLMENIIKNIAYSEHISHKKLRMTEKMIEDEIMTETYDYVNPSFKQIYRKTRLDSGIYSNTVFQWMENVERYKNGCSDLKEFGFKTQRGPSLQKRDLGRSLQIDEYRKGYNVLIYPSDISAAGYIEKVTYLGARNPIWFLGEKYILFSSEGTIGKTFIICDNSMHFTTNIHGTMIYPLDMKKDIKYSIFLGLYLNYVRSKGIFERMAVGGNGGSFAVGYWDNIRIPNVDENFMDELCIIYHNKVELNPVFFDIELIEKSGLYQLNNFLIRCKNLLKLLCNDIKENKLKTKDEYEHFAEFQ